MSSSWPYILFAFHLWYTYRIGKPWCRSFFPAYYCVYWEELRPVQKKKKKSYRSCKVLKAFNSWFRKHTTGTASIRVPLPMFGCLFVFSVCHLSFLLLSCFSLPLWFCFIFRMVAHLLFLSDVINVTASTGRNDIWELAAQTGSLSRIIQYYWSNPSPTFFPSLFQDWELHLKCVPAELTIWVISDAWNNGLSQ